MAKVEYKRQPFEEATEFFRQKINLPTETWQDIQDGMHSRAFVVAGAMQSDLLVDMRAAVDAAITEGISLDQFQKRFDAITKEHGWEFNGDRKWRARLIYSTNMRQAYNAGRYKQQMDPELLMLRPYLEYRHGGSLEPRTDHLAWSGTVLPADDPWWDIHYPANGYGCSCKVMSLSKRDLKKKGKDKPDEAPPSPEVVVRDKKTGAIFHTVKGVDPGFQYNPGQAAWGKPLSEKAMGEYKALGAEAWEKMDGGNPTTFKRPEIVPLDKPKAAIGKGQQSQEEMADSLKKILGADEKIFLPPGGSFPVLVNAQTLASHLSPDRAPYLSFLPEVLEDPFEVWLSFEKHKGTGKVVLRQRLIKQIDTAAREGMLLVAETQKGILEAWTFIPARKRAYLQNQRTGRLLYGR